MKPPQEIFLQFGEQDSEFGATWCGDRIHESDTRYILAVDEFIHGDCAACGDPEVLLQKSEDEEQPLHYVCKECFLRGY